VRHLLSGARLKIAFFAINSRLRNPDLRTAIDVLSTGNYPTFPNQLTVIRSNKFVLNLVPIYPCRSHRTNQGFGNSEISQYPTPPTTHSARSNTSTSFQLHSCQWTSHFHRPQRMATLHYHH